MCCRAVITRCTGQGEHSFNLAIVTRKGCPSAVMGALVEQRSPQFLEGTPVYRPCRNDDLRFQCAPNKT